VLRHNDNKQTGVSSPSPFKSSRWNGIGKASPQRYRRSRQSSQFYGPSHVASAMEMTNVGENSPCFLEPASEVELQAPCIDDSTIVQNMGARPNPNCSSNIVLQNKGVLEEATGMQRRAGSSTSDSHFQLLQEMKHASGHPDL
jgi:hypothetical protein